MILSAALLLLITVFSLPIRVKAQEEKHEGGIPVVYISIDEAWEAAETA